MDQTEYQKRFESVISFAQRCASRDHDLKRSAEEIADLIAQQAEFVEIGGKLRACIDQPLALKLPCPYD